MTENFKYQEWGLITIKKFLPTILRQAASSLVIFVTVGSMNSTVDPIFRAATWFAASVTLLFHAIQQPCINCWCGRFLGIKIGPFQSSYNSNWKGSSQLLKVIYHIDRTCVCFISLYTAVYETCCPTCITIIICCLGGLGHFNNTIIVVSASFVMAIYRAISMVYVAKLPLYELLLLVTGCVIGSTIVLFGPADQWPTPFRFVWHACCAIVFRFGGLVNK